MPSRLRDGGRFVASKVCERLIGPDVIAVEGDVLPAERRHVNEKPVRNDFAARTPLVDGAAEIDGVLDPMFAG